MLNFVLNISGSNYTITNDIVSNSVEPVFSLYTALHANTNKLTFKVSRTSTILNTLLLHQGEEILVTVTNQDTSPFFTGYLTDDLSWDISNVGQSDFTLTAEDPGIKKLKKVWVSTNLLFTFWYGIKICDPTDTTNSFIHKMAAMSGVSLSSSLPTITKTITLKEVDSDLKTYWDITDNVLYNFGYVFYFDEAGLLNLYKVEQSSVSPSITLSASTNVVASSDNRVGISNKRNIIQYKEVDVTWTQLKTLTNQVISHDTSGQTSTYDCLISIPAGGYYPTGSTASTYQLTSYSSPEGSAIVYVSSAHTDIVTDPGLTIDFENTGTSGKLRIYNPSGIAKNIYRLKIVADYMNVNAGTTIETSNKGKSPQLKFTSDFIYTKADALYLANLLQQYYLYAGYTATVRSSQKIPLGTNVYLDDGKGRTITVALVSCKHKYMPSADGVRLLSYDYDVVGTGNFNVSTATNSATTIASNSVQNGIANLDLSGLQNKTYENRYCRSITQPTTPTGSTPIGWTVDVPTGTDTLWVSTAQFYGSSYAGIIPSNTTYPSSSMIPGTGWSTPIAITSMPTNLTTTSVLSYIPAYLGSYISTPPSYKIGDWFFYIGTTDINFTQYTIYKWNGLTWAVDTDSGHLGSVFSDVFTYAPNCPTAISFYNILSASSAFIQDLFSKNITIQPGGVIKSSNYSSGSTGFTINYDGSAEFNSVAVRGSANLDKLTFSDVTAGSSYVMASNPMPSYICSLTYFTCYAINMPVNGSAIIYVSGSVTSGISGYIRVLKNGSILIGETAFSNTSSGVIINTSVSFNKGDKFEIQQRTSSNNVSYNGTIDTFQMRVANDPGILQYITQVARYSWLG